MKLYHHYKNMPYKYLGLARHSETLEEMVIYETRYENDKGKIWVRPKNMFFEPVHVGGQSVPRFKEVPLKLIATTNVAEAEVNLIAPVIEKAFGEWDPNWFYSKFKNHKKFHLVTAFIEDKAVGFKLGFEHDPRQFYSWLGGVIPEYRGLGIASDLMNHQHEWCCKEGYTKIQTKTQNRFREMLILNLKHGFEVIGTHQSDEGGFKIILEKRLQSLLA
jgi:GNAT superfamily N-acetyltransferase